MNKTAKAKYVKQYQKDNVKRYTFKINYKNEDATFLALWDLVKNKSACIKYCLNGTSDIFGYLIEKQGYTEDELCEYMADGKWEERQHELKEHFKKTLSTSGKKNESN